MTAVQYFPENCSPKTCFPENRSIEHPFPEPDNFPQHWSSVAIDDTQPSTTLVRRAGNNVISVITYQEIEATTVIDVQFYVLNFTC